MTPKRVQRKRTQGWRMPANTVYVGRPSMWGNPFVAAEFFRAWITEGKPHRSPHSSKEKLADIERRRKKILRMIGQLRGKNLACWCPLDQPCHADVLLKIANS